MGQVNYIILDILDTVITVMSGLDAKARSLESSNTVCITAAISNHILLLHHYSQEFAYTYATYRWCDAWN